jgi:hypothetical protein
MNFTLKFHNRKQSKDSNKNNNKNLHRLKILQNIFHQRINKNKIKSKSKSKNKFLPPINIKP